MAILLGLLLNFLGKGNALFTAPVIGGFLSTLQLLANLTIPVMLIIIGYGLQLNTSGLKESMPVITTRLLILIPSALAISIFVFDKLLVLESAFGVALFTLAVLPPFIIPLYMNSNDSEEKRYVNNTLAFYTLISVAIFIIFFILNPSL